MRSTVSAPLASPTEKTRKANPTCTMCGRRRREQLVAGAPPPAPSFPVASLAIATSAPPNRGAP